jgi:hypothetical protein
MATFRSLQATGATFHLYVVCFDDDCFEMLQLLKKTSNLTQLTPISLAEFEDEALLSIKPTRTRGEYCWTCTPSVVRYCLEKFQLPNCTYIDADMWFYNNPSVLIEELDDSKSVLITEHRYTRQYDQSKKSGIYCVQFVYFRNDENGKKVLNWWREQCLEWCFNRQEDGKFGDQKYLDDWTTRFEGVHVLQHLGGGLAPWNVQQYEFNENETFKINGIEKTTRQAFSPIFFHFHGLKTYGDGHQIFAPKKYILSENVLRYFYNPYILILQQIKSELNQTNPTRDWSGELPTPQYKADKKRGLLDYWFSNYIKRWL